MPIQCSEINQNINYLLTAFEDCSKLKASDMQLLVELIAAVNTCANGGPDYNNLETDIYEPDINEIVNYPINTFHSVSVVATAGNFILNGATYPSGVTINIEFTTLNQQAFIFTAVAGSRIVVNYITE